jgi:type III restriction enzyme
MRWSRTFDRELHGGGHNAGLPAAESQAWLNRVLHALMGERGVAVAVLNRRRHELADLIGQRSSEHGRKQVREAARLLFESEGERRLETTIEWPFEVMEQDYASYRRYAGGPFTYTKHAFELVGDMGDEESQCAKKIDDHANVNRWIRNLVFESAGGFSLPLSLGRFFPDFIAELHDGRIAVFEYKGGHLAEQRKELHKEEVGKLWAARSGARAASASLFAS